GTHRGAIWRMGLESYRDFPWLQKLFGYGPDTFGIVMVNEHYQEMTDLYREIFDSAHNEYLQYFITIGPLGLLSYLTLLISSGIRMVKRAGQNPYAMAILFALICYGVQAFVNINLPIATPVMWTLLMMGLAESREIETKGSVEEV
ncbi:MAG: O-antigen ligase family protein, partial [Hungatella sp.]